ENAEDRFGREHRQREQAVLGSRDRLGPRLRLEATHGWQSQDQQRSQPAERNNCCAEDQARAQGDVAEEVGELALPVIEALARRWASLVAEEPFGNGACRGERALREAHGALAGTKSTSKSQGQSLPVIRKCSDSGIHAMPLSTSALSASASLSRPAPSTTP